MSDEFEKLFTLEADKAKRAELCSLMNEWRKHIKTKDKILFDGAEYPAEHFFSPDGFYPGYFKEGNKKILYIGREPRYTSSTYTADYCEALMNHFKNEDLNFNKDNCISKELYLKYGIMHEGKIPYGEVPCANDIIKEMNASNDYGFAFMNISKYSNDGDDGGSANFGMINCFLSDCDLEKRNFIREELAILDPDIIITMNLWDGKIDQEKLALAFPNEDFTEIAKSENNDAVLYDFKLNGKTIKLVDAWHFSSRKSPETSFYNPIMELLFPNKN